MNFIDDLILLAQYSTRVPASSLCQSSMGSLCGKKKDHPATTQPVPLTATPGTIEVNPRRKTVSTTPKRTSSEKFKRKSLPLKLEREKKNQQPSPGNLHTIISESESYLDKLRANSEDEEIERTERAEVE